MKKGTKIRRKWLSVFTRAKIHLSLFIFLFIFLNIFTKLCFTLSFFALLFISWSFYSVVYFDYPFFLLKHVGFKQYIVSNKLLYCLEKWKGKKMCEMNKLFVYIYAFRRSTRCRIPSLETSKNLTKLSHAR